MYLYRLSTSKDVAAEYVYTMLSYVKIYHRNNNYIRHYSS